MNENSTTENLDKKVLLSEKLTLSRLSLTRKQEKNQSLNFMRYTTECIERTRCLQHGNWFL